MLRLLKRLWHKRKNPLRDPDSVTWEINGVSVEFRFPKRSQRKPGAYDSQEVTFLNIEE